MQERCKSEVRRKLYEKGVPKSVADKFIEQLEEENFLNEERFARTFVRGKFRMNKWGKLKISAHLKQLQIPNEFINNAIKEIDEKEYLNVLKQLIEKKSREINETDIFVKKQKLANYLVSKGFEIDIVFSLI